MNCQMFAMVIALAVAVSLGNAQVHVSLDLESPPLNYSETPAENRVSHLIEQLANEELELEFTREHGYLRALLVALEIPESSQVLVFSQTSMQVDHISPRNPRAIYFNDDTYLGWINGSSLVEISTSDPKLGAAFYTLAMSPRQAKIERRNYDCLACHATSMTQGIPGHTIRSVYPTYDGNIDPQRKSFVTNEKSPFDQRWGGWYVTGTHGAMRHMGNTYLRGGELNTLSNGNLASVDKLFDASDYLSPHSDIRALMVLEHQTQMHNTMTRADLSVRSMLHARSTLDEDEWQLQLELLAKEVVDRMFFCDEFILTAPVQGSEKFTADFVKRGPFDQHGRSLREFDMHQQMFKYPLSYLIYSKSFDALNGSLRKEIARQILAVLVGQHHSAEYAHLDDALRAEILAILEATKPELFL